MRVTNSLLFSTSVANVERQSARRFQALNEASSGKKLQRPSDDPTSTRQVLSLREQLGSLAQYGKARTTLRAFLDANEAAFQDLETLVLKAKELAIRASNDTARAETRAIMAREMGSIFEQALHLGNTAVDGRYIFAGQENAAPPFVAQATVESTSSRFATSGTLVAPGDGTLLINGLSIRVPLAADDTVSTSDHAASSLALARALNAATARTGVRATASTTRALTATGFGDLAAGDLAINGVAITGTITDAPSLVATINAAQVPGVVASSTGAANLTLTAADGRNLQLTTTGLSAGGLTFAEFDLSGGNPLDQTATGTVTLQADHAFTLGGSDPTAAGFRAGPVNLTASFRGDNNQIALAPGPGQTLPVNILTADFLVADLQPRLDQDTPLASLKQGQGVQAGAITLTDRAGNTVTLDLSGAATVGDILDAISQAPTLNVTATINEAGTGVVLTDDNAVPTRNLTVTNTGGSTTATDLGIAADRPGTLVGTHGFLIEILPASGTPQTCWDSQQSLRALPENCAR